MSKTLKLFESTFSYIPADKGLNFIVCKEFKETFLNVYELVIAGKHIIAECVDTIDNNPVIKINVEFNDKSYDALFVVKEGDDNIIFNPATLRHGSKILQTEKHLLEEIAADDIIITEDIVEDIVKPDVKLDIEKYKRDALKIIGENYIDKKSKIEDLKVGLVSLIEKNLSDIRSTSVTDINTIKTQLHESVIEQVNNYKIDTDASITEINNIRENVLATVDLYVDNIKQVVSDKTEDLTSLQESVIYSINDKIAELDLATENHRKEVEEAFAGLSQLADNSSVKITGLVGEIYEDVSKVKQTTIDELNAELVNVTASVNSKLQDLQSKADKKISSISKLVESKISELQTEKDKTHVELISAKNELVTSLQEAIKTFEIETADKTAGLLEIKHQFLEQVKLQSDTISAAVNENKQEIETLTTKITEAVEEKIKKINLVATKKEDLAQLKKQLEQRIDAESANIKKVVASYGGGGSVAVQYANGGTMNGSLNIATGQILSGGIDISTFFGGGGGTVGAYLPLSGGTVTGVLSTTNVIYASGGNSNQWNNTYSTVQTSSASWNPAGSYLPLSGGTLTGTLNVIGGGISAIGPTLTGSQATNSLSVSANWNTTGNPVLIYGRVANIASGSTARLIDLGTDSTGSLISLSKTGQFQAGQTGQTGGDHTFVNALGSNQGFRVWSGSGTGGVRISYFGLLLGGGYNLGFGSDVTGIPDAIISREAPSILAQVNGSNAQTLRFYNTYTNTSNYERGFTRWSGSSFTATINGSLMTMTVAAVGTFAIGQRIAGTGVTSGTLINSLSTGTLGAINSTYVVSTSQTVSAATVMNSYSDVFQVGTEKLGTGSARALSLVTDGTERINIGTTGNITITSPLSTNQDMEITDATKGIILKSPNGTKYRVTVSNAGELTTTLI